MVVYSWGVLGLAWVRAVCTLDFEVEGGGHDSAFVVASEEVDGIGVGEFHDQDQGYYFDAEAASVDVIAQKEVFGVRRVPKFLEDVEQVVKLPVDIPNDNNRRGDSQHIGLIFYIYAVNTEKMAGLVYDVHQDILGESLLFFEFGYDLRDVVGMFMLFIFIGFFLGFGGGLFIFFFHLRGNIIINRKWCSILHYVKVIYRKYW